MLSTRNRNCDNRCIPFANNNLRFSRAAMTGDPPIPPV